MDAIALKRADYKDFTRKATQLRADMAMELLKKHSVPIVAVGPQKYRSLMNIGEAAVANMDDAGAFFCSLLFSL